MLALVFSIVAAIEILRRVPLLQAFRDLALVGARSPRVWAYRRGLEARKERATRLLSVRMFGCSISALWMIMMVFLPIGLVLAVDPWLGLDTREALLNWRDRLVVAMLSLTYGLARIQIARRLQQP
jgi:hypothetical protein